MKKHSEGSDDTFIIPYRVPADMSGKSEKTIDTKDIPPFGDLEYDIPDEVIEKDIKDYPYVIGKLKDC